MNKEFFEKLNSAKPSITKSKVKDSVKAVYPFEWGGHKFKVELEKFLHWHLMLQYGGTQVEVNAHILVQPKDSGDEHYVYGDMLLLNTLGLDGIGEGLNAFVQRNSSEISLSESDIQKAVELFNKRTEGFNKTINKFVEVKA